jgi:hypothetical protein
MPVAVPGLRRTVPPALASLGRAHAAPRPGHGGSGDVRGTLPRYLGGIFA